ncbi:hypothetical protein SKAU_G00133230 [Synaphobranchus kaupii]|uniref:Uncharacterized protein n=1 Tax=Synaphobranchus kaupii TaxID=118154 RepID=A0A9Q1FQX0_SYNKA|nr:hypothetical protein SKAU_G00133230 [Synaphobranchus kaupii]
MVVGCARLTLAGTALSRCSVAGHGGGGSVLVTTGKLGHINIPEQKAPKRQVARIPRTRVWVSDWWRLREKANGTKVTGPSDTSLTSNTASSRGTPIPCSHLLLQSRPWRLPPTRPSSLALAPPERLAAVAWAYSAAGAGIQTTWIDDGSMGRRRGTAVLVRRPGGKGPGGVLVCEVRGEGPECSVLLKWQGSVYSAFMTHVAKWTGACDSAHWSAHQLS